MYIFVMLTGSTTMVFSYILPMLALLVPHHNPKLILFTGVASLLIDIFSIAVADAYDAMTGDCVIARKSIELLQAGSIQGLSPDIPAESEVS